MKRTYRKNKSINEKHYEMYKKQKDDGENPGILLKYFKYLLNTYNSQKLISKLFLDYL